MRMKKTICLCAVLAILASLLCQMTYAYFTVTLTADNAISTGGIGILVQEVTADGKVVAPTVSVMPGQMASRIVTVRNLEEEAFVRMWVDVTAKDGKGQPVKLADNMLIVDYDTESWTLKDGAWYYKESLQKDQTTKPLFTGVAVDFDNISNELQSASVTVNVRAEATQAANNGTDPLKAAGWPKP